VNLKRAVKVILIRTNP